MRCEYNTKFSHNSTIEFLVDFFLIIIEYLKKNRTKPTTSLTLVKCNLQMTDCLYEFFNVQ